MNVRGLRGSQNCMWRPTAFLVLGTLLLASLSRLPPSFASKEDTCKEGSCLATGREMAWADEEDAGEMTVNELVSELEGHVARLKMRYEAGELSEGELKTTRKEVKMHYRKLLVSNGAERTILDKLKGKGAKSRSGGDKGVGGAGGKGSHCVVEPGVDYPGGSCNQHSCVGSDIRFVRGVSDPGACCLLCQKESKCAYWTYASMEIEHVGQKQVCWLKTADARTSRKLVPGHVALISGYVYDRIDSSQRQADGPGESDSAGESETKLSNKLFEKARGLAQVAQAAFDKGILQESAKLFEESIAINPDSGSALLRYAIMLERSGKKGDCAKIYSRALAAKNPALVGREKLVAENNLGLMYKDELNQPALAEEVFKKSIKEMEEADVKNFHYCYKNLGQLLEKNSRTVEAIHYLRKAADIKKDDGLLIYTALLLPYVYQDDDDVMAWRENFKANVKKLAKTKLLVQSPIDMDGVPQYYLSYHGKNDAKINSRIAKMFRKASPSVNFVAPHIASYKTPHQDDKIKVGFISYYFRDHSVTKMVAGLLKNLDKKKFEIVLFQIGNSDDKTRILEGYVSKVVMLGGLNFNGMQGKISAERLDVAVYAEIGMDPHSYSLAMGRQAPIQIAMHGHASTTGIDTLDYYVTYEGFSEPDAQNHYSETLLQLPGHTPLPLYYDIVPFKLPPRLQAEQGIAEWRRKYNIPIDKTVYACTQTLFKVSPKLDWVAKGILEGDGNAVVLLKELPMTDQVGKLVVERMRKTLTPQQMRRIVFLPPLADGDYLSMYGAVDVVLDSFPFGGHTSTMDAFSAGAKPVVTLPTKLMSGRCTQGFYHHMGITELVADSIEEYLAIALRLGQDKEFRAAMSRRIADKLPSLIGDETSVKAWGSMLTALVRDKDKIKDLLWDNVQGGGKARA